MKSIVWEKNHFKITRTSDYKKVHFFKLLMADMNARCVQKYATDISRNKSIPKETRLKEYANNKL